MRAIAGYRWIFPTCFGISAIQDDLGHGIFINIIIIHHQFCMFFIIIRAFL